MKINFDARRLHKPINLNLHNFHSQAFAGLTKNVYNSNNKNQNINLGTIKNIVILLA